MQNNNEINALLLLLEDPDEIVFDTVSDKIISFGKSIIPNLEQHWDTVPNIETQEKIEQLIHKLHFRDLSLEFDNWILNGGDLLSGAILLSKYHYPDLNPTLIFQEIEKLRRNIWLELNNYLTPMERINVFNSILYSFSKQNGLEIDYAHPEHFLINKTLENRSGNIIGNGIIYLILSHLLDIPVRAVQIPNQFILAYFDDQFDLPVPSMHPSQKILFFIDPLGGQMYTHKDVESYFKRLPIEFEPKYFRPLHNFKVMQYLIEELSKCFDSDNNQYKKNELLSLANKLQK